MGLAVTVDSTGSPPPRGSRGSPCPRSAPLVCDRPLKAGVSPKILSERIGHAHVGFFLQTYAHVSTNDDREAAEQAASFLIGDGWDPEPDDKQA